MEKPSRSINQSEQVNNFAETSSRLKSTDHLQRRIQSQKIFKNNQENRFSTNQISYSSEKVGGQLQLNANIDNKRKTLNKNDKNRLGHEQSYLQDQRRQRSRYDNEHNQQHENLVDQDNFELSLLNNSSLFLNNNPGEDHTLIMGAEIPLFIQKIEERILDQQVYNPSQQKNYFMVNNKQEKRKEKRYRSITPEQTQIKDIQNLQKELSNISQEDIQEFNNWGRQNMEQFLKQALNQNPIKSLDDQILQTLENYFPALRNVTMDMTNQQKATFLLQNLNEERLNLANPKFTFLQKKQIKQKRETLYDDLIDKLIEKDNLFDQFLKQIKITSEKMMLDNQLTKKRLQVLSQIRKIQKQTFPKLSNTKKTAPRGLALSGLVVFPIYKKRQQQPIANNQLRQNQTVTALKNSGKQLRNGLEKTLIDTAEALCPNKSKNWKWIAKLKIKL